jgi:hypothetical protein
MREDDSESGKTIRRRGDPDVVTRASSGEKERLRWELLPPEADLRCKCCGKGKERIDEDVTEALDYKPSSFIIK